MKKTYEKTEADKIAFNYRDQVVAASNGSSSGGGFMENSAGIGSPFCGSGGIVDWLFDYVGSDACD